MPNKSKKFMRFLTLLLALVISLAVPLQSLSATTFAASTAASSSSAASDSSSSASSTSDDESIDEWMPDTNLQKAVYTALSSWDYSNDDHGEHEILTDKTQMTNKSQITKAMMGDILYLNTIKDDGSNAADHVKGITDLTGLQYATKLQQFDFSGSTIEKEPGDDTSRSWSAFANATSSKLGFVDVNSKDIDLKGLASLNGVSISNAGLSSANNSGETPGPQVTKLIEGQNITYNPIFSKKEAYIPLSNWYPGFMNSDGTFTYHTLTTGLASAAYPGKITGAEYDSDANRLKVDLGTWGNKTLNISDFDIKDVVASALAPSGTAQYYSAQNSLDAVIPVPDQINQAVQVSQEDATGAIKTANLGLATTDNNDVQIQVPTDYDDASDSDNTKYLTASDISLTPDLQNDQIKFTLTDTGLKKLSTNDVVTADVMITVDGKVIELTLNVTEPLDDWMPDKTLQQDLQADLTAEGLGSLTRTNLAKLDSAENLSGVSNLTGLEYATSLTHLKITGTDDARDNLNDLKPTNSAVLSKLTALTNLKINNTDLGGSLAGWGLNNLKKLAYLVAEDDQLKDSDVLDYGSDENLVGLDLSKNDLTGNIDQFPVASWPILGQLQLSDNQLTGSLPDLTKNSGMQYVDLSRNKLTGTIPGSYSQLSQLTTLMLSSNNLTGTLPTLEKDTQLANLYLDSNQLAGKIPAEWSGLANLTKLDLASNALAGEMTNIAQLTNLKKVFLSSNGFTGNLPAGWFTDKLTDFQATYNNFSGTLPDSLSNATNLTDFEIQNNQFTGDLPDLTGAKNLTTMSYGANHITSGRTVASAGGNYQTWSIVGPDWQTASDGTMTLDLSKYYGGEQGQDGYQYLGISLPSGETGVALDKTDSAHPLLTVAPGATVGKSFQFDLFDQAGKQAKLDGSDGITSMNYDARVTVSLAKNFQINTKDVEFGSHAVGAGAVNAGPGTTDSPDFKLSVTSDGAAGDSYQLTAQLAAGTSGLVSAGHEVPLYYYNGQHSILLNDTAQSIYDYQPTSDADTTIVGDSSDATKGNLRTDIGATAYTGDYKGDITYTLASAPADTTTASSSDTSTITAATLSGLSPKLAALDATQEAVRAKLQTNMTSFAANQLADEDGVLYSSYEAGHDTDGSREELTETSGMWLLALANSGDTTTFNTAFNAVVKRFYDSKTQTFNWQSSGANHTITAGSASIDDLRIIQALLVMNQKNPDNTRTAWINQLIDGFTKYDLNPYYQMIDGYSTANGQEKRIRLDYLDFATLKAIYEAKGLGTAGATAYQQQLKLVKDSYISDQFPLFATYYNYSTGAYQVVADAGENGITTDHFNITDSLLTMLNLAKVGELPQTSLNWLKLHTSDRTIYNDYNLDGTPVSKTDAGSNYAYVAQIAAAIGDTDLYNQALTVMKSMTSDDDNSGESKLESTDPLYGSAQYGGESYAFNDLNMLLAYNSVAFGTTSSTK